MQCCGWEYKPSTPRFLQQISLFYLKAQGKGSEAQQSCTDRNLHGEGWSVSASDAR